MKNLKIIKTNTRSHHSLLNAYVHTLALVTALSGTLALSGCNDDNELETGFGHRSLRDAVNDADFKLLYLKEDYLFSENTYMLLEPLNYSHVALDGFSLTWDQLGQLNGSEIFPRYTISLQGEDQLRMATEILSGQSNQTLDLSQRPATHILATVSNDNNSAPQAYNLPTFKILPKRSINDPYKVIIPSEANYHFNSSSFSWAPRVQWDNIFRVVVQKDQSMEEALVKVTTQNINKADYENIREDRCNTSQSFLNYHNATAAENAIAAKRSHSTNIEIQAYAHLMPGADQNHALLAINGRPVDDFLPIDLNSIPADSRECFEQFLQLDGGPTLPYEYLRLHNAVKNRSRAINPPVLSIQDQIQNLRDSHTIGEPFDIISPDNRTVRIHINSSTPRVFELLREFAMRNQVESFWDAVAELLNRAEYRQQLLTQTQIELEFKIFTLITGVEGLFFGFEHAGERYNTMGPSLSNALQSNFKEIYRDRVLRQQLRATHQDRALERMNEFEALVAQEVESIQTILFDHTVVSESIEMISQLSSFRNLSLPALSGPNARGQVRRTTRTLRFDGPDASNPLLLEILNQTGCLTREFVGQTLSQNINRERLGALEGDIIGTVSFYLLVSRPNIEIRLQLKNTQGQGLITPKDDLDYGDTIFLGSISPSSHCGAALLNEDRLFGENQITDENRRILRSEPTGRSGRTQRIRDTDLD